MDSSILSLSDLSTAEVLVKVGSSKSDPLAEYLFMEIHMPHFLDGSELLLRLGDEISKTKSADLAVAFWGKGAADKLGIRDGMTVRIICNLMSGGTNPNEIRKLRDRGAEVHQLNDLHAKIGVVGNISFVGSSNMSANGLGAEGTDAHWREANVVYDSVRPGIVGMFDKYWQCSDEISEANLETAAKIWADRQRGNALVAARRGGRSLIDVLRTAPAELDALNVRMVVYDTVTDPDQLKLLEKADEYARDKHGKGFEAYWNWESMAETAQNAYLVNFDWPALGDIEDGSLYRRNTDLFGDFRRGKHKFYPAYEIDDIEGITYGSADKSAIQKAFHAYVKAGAKSEEEGERAYNFPISELGPYLPSAT